jgi:YVTN family beta-propeller protein
VTDVASNDVSVLDSTTGQISATVPVGSYPIGVAIAPDDKRLYVASYLSDSVAVVDTDTHAVVASIHVDGGPYGVAVSPVPSALLGGQGWELVADSGLARGNFAPRCSASSRATSTCSEVRSRAPARWWRLRYENGALASVGTVTGQDYNRFLDYGAVEQWRALRRRRHGGKLYRMDVAGNGTASVHQVALVGGEDVFPGPSCGLIACTFGCLGSNPLNPAPTTARCRPAHEFG